jgi:hypothetical protein
MASTFWALNAARRARSEPVPGTSKWVANELYTVNLSVLSSAELFAHGMSDDFDRLNAFMKSVTEGSAISYTVPHDQEPDSVRESVSGLLLVQNGEQNGEPDGNSIVVPPREDPKTFATNVNGSHDEATVIVSGKAPSNRSSGVASPSNFTFIQVDPFDNLDHDDSFQAIRTAIRKSIAGKPKTVSPGVSETPGKVPTVAATSDGVQSLGRKSGFVPLPTKEPLSTIVLDRRSTRPSLKLQGSLTSAPRDLADSALASVLHSYPEPEPQLNEPRTHVDASPANLRHAVAKLIRGSGYHDLESPKQSPPPLSRKPVALPHMHKDMPFQELLFGAQKSVIHGRELLEAGPPQATSLATPTLPPAPKLRADPIIALGPQNSIITTSASKTPEKPRNDQFSGSVLRRARNLFLSDDASVSTRFQLQEGTIKPMTKQLKSLELALPRRPKSIQKPSSRITSPIRPITTATSSITPASRSQSPTRPKRPTQPPRLDSSPQMRLSTSARRDEPLIIKQTDLISRLMVPTSASAAKTSRLNPPETKKNDHGVKNKLLTATLNPIKPPKFSPNKNRYGTLREQVSNRPIQSPVKRSEADKQQPERLEDENIKDHRYHTRQRVKYDLERDRDRDKQRPQKAKPKIIIALNHKLDSKLPPLKTSLQNPCFNREDELKRRKTDKYISRTAPTTTTPRPARLMATRTHTTLATYSVKAPAATHHIDTRPPQKSTLDQSAKLGEFTNPYKTPGKSVKLLMSPSDLPEILTDDEDNKEKRVFEPWAQTPQLKRVLLHQQHLNPDKIFGAIPPMDIEDIFESQASRQRGRASMSNWSPTSK